MGLGKNLYLVSWQKHYDSELFLRMDNLPLYQSNAGGFAAVFSFSKLV